MNLPDAVGSPGCLITSNLPISTATLARRHKEHPAVSATRSTVMGPGMHLRRSRRLTRLLIAGFEYQLKGSLDVVDGWTGAHHCPFGAVPVALKGVAARGVLEC